MTGGWTQQRERDGERQRERQRQTHREKKTRGKLGLKKGGRDGCKGSKIIADLEFVIGVARKEGEKSET